jgi:predicted MFS family arabinose efflux permease
LRGINVRFVRIPTTGLWRHRDFLNLWAGETISIFGTLIGQLALSFVAIIWLDATAGEVAILALCQIVPGFVVGPIAGVWVDRVHRRPIMIAADLGRFAALTTIPLAAVFDALTVEQLWAVAAVAGALTVFFDVAYQSYLPTLVKREELIEGNSKLETTASVAEVGGFGIAGWLVQVATAPGAVLVDALSFLWSAVFIWRIKSPEPPPPPVHERQHAVREALEGLQVLYRNAILRALTAAAILYAVSSRLITVVLLLYLNRELGYGAGVLGMIFAIGGVTSIPGAYLASRSEKFGGLGPAIVVAAFLRVLGVLALAAVWDVNAWGYAFLIGGQLFDAAWMFYNINELSLRQAIAEPRVQGRVHATNRFLEFGAMVIGTVAAGFLGSAIGFRETLWLAVAFQFAAATTLLFSPVVKLRETPRTPPVALEEPVAFEEPAAAG